VLAVNQTLCKGLLVMNATNYINAKGQEIIVCKGGWKISREKMEANQIKRIAEQEKAKADRQAFRRAKLDAAIASGDTEEIEYLRFMYSM
jgi:hypothetical protein